MKSDFDKQIREIVEGIIADANFRKEQGGRDYTDTRVSQIKQLIKDEVIGEMENTPFSRSEPHRIRNEARNELRSEELEKLGL